MRVCPEIEMIPALHGKELFAREARKICSAQKFDCIAVDIPALFQDGLGAAVDELPLISALIAYEDGVYGGGSGGIGVDVDVDGDGDDGDICYYVPVDPCDAMIEGVRQARQRRIPFYCVGSPILRERKPLPPLPDEYSIEKIGFDAYSALCIAAAADVSLEYAAQKDAKYICQKLEGLRLRYDNILHITHLGNFEAVKNIINPAKSYTNRLNEFYGIWPEGSGPAPEGYMTLSDTLESEEGMFARMKDPSDPLYDGDFKILDDDGYGERFTVITRHINPDHLYFALGELPFITAKSQMERQDPFAEPMDLTDAIKELFRETRDNYFDDKEQAMRLSPVRIQAALTYLRNLTVMSGRLIPSLFDIVEAAKGVGGNAYALRILKSAKYYPFLPTDGGDTAVNIGIDRISLAKDGACPGEERETCGAANLFRDTDVYWRRIDIKPDPTSEQKKKYRYSWGPRSLCSHLPEDARLESFNSHARGKAKRIVTEHLARTEKFTASVKDGIDIRETLRNWHTGGIYVKELPPAGSKIDTVVIIFDEDHDVRYPQRATWYAEHEGESTLSFYATGLFDNLIGPGIARCSYGGVSLLYPPRDVPDIFLITGAMGIEGCAARLVAGSLLYSAEKNVAFISPKAPSLRLRALSGRFKKHLVWIPMNAFSTETLSRLRHFHVLNGKNVRSWAARFIGDSA